MQSMSTSTLGRDAYRACDFEFVIFKDGGRQLILDDIFPGVLLFGAADNELFFRLPGQFLTRGLTSILHDPVPTALVAKNKTYYLIKNARLSMVFMHLFIVVLSIMKRTLIGPRGRDYKGMIDGLIHDPRMLRKRRKIQSTRVINNSQLTRWFK